jgi:deferrochelatase/peroxidase EfeB
MGVITNDRSQHGVAAASDVQTTVEASDVQAIVLRPRPKPYVGEYVVLRIGDAGQGRQMVRRILPHVAPAEEWWVPSLPGWLGIAFTFEGLKALGVPQLSLDSFPVEFRQGMAARAEILHDWGANAPEHWEYPFGTADVHVALAIYGRNERDLQRVLDLARRAHDDLPQISVVYRMQFGELPEGRNPFGFKDGLHNPHVEGSGPRIRARSADQGRPSSFWAIPTRTRAGPGAGSSGSCATTVPSWPSASSTWMLPRFAATCGRRPRRRRKRSSWPPRWWAAGAAVRPLVLAPDRDNPELGSDRNRNNVFSYADDMKGLKCPFSAHIRRVNPRDALKDEVVAVNLHHFLRRGTNYGPPLPEGVLEDDGAERGGVFLLIGAHLKRQFEFIQSQWVTDGNFISHGTEQDPLIGNNDGDGDFTIPQRPARRRLHGLPRFVTVRGGEYCFIPGLRALRWLADLGSSSA